MTGCVLNESSMSRNGGIGDATLSLLQDITQDLHLSPLEVMRNADQYPVLSKKMNALKKFAVMWDELIEAERELPLEKFLDVVLEKTGYRAALEQMGEEGTFRLENVEELKSSILTYQNEAEEPSLGGFLEEISLYTDVDKYEPEQDVVMLMTVHSAKGLEFRTSFWWEWSRAFSLETAAWIPGKIWKRNAAWRMWHLPVPRKS